MQKPTKKKQNNLVYGITISILLHIILIFFLYVFYIKKNKLSLISTNKKYTIPTGYISTQKQSVQPTQSLSSASEERGVSHTIKTQTTFTEKQDGIKKNTYNYKLNNLLNKLINCKNISILHNEASVQFQKKLKFNDKKYDTILYETNIYKNILIKEIRHKFYDSVSYSGKTCVVRVKLPSNCTPVTIKSSDGDLPLCQAAISAIKLANFPSPPNLEIYEIFKNITLNFSP